MLQQWDCIGYTILKIFWKKFLLVQLAKLHSFSRRLVRFISMRRVDLAHMAMKLFHS